MSERWLLPPLWFDFCWELGGFDEIPFPLAVRSHGETVEERSARVSQSMDDMRAAGLFQGGSTLAPRFAQVLGTIAKPGLWIEGLWMPDDVDESPVRLMSIATEEGAVLVVQQPGETEEFGGDLEITTQPRSTPAAAAVSGMPPARPGSRKRMSAPVSGIKPEQGGSDEDASVMRSNGLGGQAGRTAREMRTMLEQQHYRGGQFTANLRDRYGRAHRSAVLRWFDAHEPDGRYGMNQENRSGGEPNIVICPVGPAELGRALENRVREVRSAASA